LYNKDTEWKRLEPVSSDYFITKNAVQIRGIADIPVGFSLSEIEVNRLQGENYSLTFVMKNGQRLNL